MLQKKHCVGIVATNRWNLTQKTLQSIYHADQPKDSFDLFIIDNGSSDAVSADLKEWVQGGLIPVKNLITLKKTYSLGPAWNLFLNITQDYTYRTKLDNDLVFANTPVSADEKEDSTSRRGLKRRTGEFPTSGINPGATPVASFQIGAGKNINKSIKKSHTRFLDHLEETIKKNNLGISALVPVPVGNTLAKVLPTMCDLSWRNYQCIVGGCMTISKECFDKIGYFEDKLLSHIDYEYSQRAMGEGINVGYVPDYCVVDLGEGISTLSPEMRQQNEWNTKQIAPSLDVKRGFVHTKWESVHKKLAKSMSKNTIVNLT